MKEYIQFLDEYVFSGYSMYSRIVPEKEWGNKQIAFDYLEKYFLSGEDYLNNWKPIQDSIFQNGDKGLPAMVFRDDYSLIASRGGILFEKDDFEKLRTCIEDLGEKYMIIIQNDFGGTIKKPCFRMKYPANITWDELMSGNYISSVIFEMFANEYFVFSESGRWGKYSANDYIHPLDVVGFNPNLELIFRKQFKDSLEDLQLQEWLPSIYKDRIC